MEAVGDLFAGLIGLLVGGLLMWTWFRIRPSTITTSGSRAADPWAPRGSTPGLSDRDSDMVARELERGRRYERPFALVRLPDEAFDEPGAPAAAAVDAVVGALRTIDFAWVDEAGMHILLPEARRTEGEACIRRLVEVAPSLANASAQLAVFPDDGVTRGALFSRLAGTAEALPAADDLPSPPTPIPDIEDAAAAPTWAS